MHDLNAFTGSSAAGLPTMKPLPPWNGSLRESDIFDEAIDWIFYLKNADPEAPDPYPTPTARGAALLAWLNRSATHQRVFYEELQMERALQLIALDSSARAAIERLIRAQTH